MIGKAQAFATAAHAEQTRKYHGGPYIDHPRRVAERVAALPGATDAMVAAAWLHDVVEDCGVTLTTIEAEFGADVASIVGQLTHTSKVDYPHLNRAGRKAKDREHLAAAGREAKLIKLVDRIDNLRDLASSGDVDFSKVYAAEALLLLDALGDVDAALAAELRDAVDGVGVAG